LDTAGETDLMALDKVKPDHNGAKNGGGAFCCREDAKRASNKIRRRMDRREVAAQEVKPDGSRHRHV
jgi:hypothetical protein